MGEANAVLISKQFDRLVTKASRKGANSRYRTNTKGFPRRDHGIASQDWGVIEMYLFLASEILPEVPTDIEFENFAVFNFSYDPCFKRRNVSLIK